MSLKCQETYISRVHQLQMIYPGLQILYTESFEIFICGMSIGITQEQENVMKIEIKLSQSILGE